MRELDPACPPGTFDSRTSTLSPSDAPYTAAASPAGPVPTTTRSFTRVWSTVSLKPRQSAICALGPDEALIAAIIELKSRNPRFGCPRIARIISQTFGIDLDKNVVYRVLAKHSRPAPGGSEPSWLSFIG